MRYRQRLFSVDVSIYRVAMAPAIGTSLENASCQGTVGAHLAPDRVVSPPPSSGMLIVRLLRQCALDI